jgi:Got1/Sft2-like family
MSFKFFIELIEGYPVPFALNYSFGNILALASSWFLCGPKRQFKSMMDEKRRITSITYLTCLAGTLVIVFLPLPWAPKLFTLVVLVLTQCGASFWYSLSYIPYGRKTVLNIIKRTFGMNERSIVNTTEG